VKEKPNTMLSNF